MSRIRSDQLCSCWSQLFLRSWLAIIALLAIQSSAQTFIHNAILFIDTSNNARYSEIRWLIRKPYICRWLLVMVHLIFLPSCESYYVNAVNVDNLMKKITAPVLVNLVSLFLLKHKHVSPCTSAVYSQYNKILGFFFKFCKTIFFVHQFHLTSILMNRWCKR